MRFSYDLVAVGHKVAAQIVVALRRIIVDERAALDGDGAGVAVVLVQNIILAIPTIIRLEEAALDSDVTTFALNDRVAIAICIAA